LRVTYSGTIAASGGGRGVAVYVTLDILLSASIVTFVVVMVLPSLLLVVDSAFATSSLIPQPTLGARERTRCEEGGWRRGEEFVCTRRA
jgi:hypothetical protein